MSTPFTEYRDSIAIYEGYKFDYGLDSLVYYLPYIDQNAKCQLRVELYRPGSRRDDKWKVKLNVDGTMQHMINLSAGELKILELDVPAVVNMDGEAKIKFERVVGDFILLRRILWFEYERNERLSGACCDGIQSDATQYLSPIFFESFYPNPAKGDLKIRLNALQERRIAVKLYDVTGRLIKDLFKGNVIGINEILVSSENLAVGVYFIRMEADKEVITEKIVFPR